MCILGGSLPSSVLLHFLESSCVVFVLGTPILSLFPFPEAFRALLVNVKVHLLFLNLVSLGVVLVFFVNIVEGLIL